MSIHCSSQTKDKAEIKFMAEKTTNIPNDWQQKPEEELFVCSRMEAVDTEEKSRRRAESKVKENEREPQSEDIVNS